MTGNTEGFKYGEGLSCVMEEGPVETEYSSQDEKVLTAKVQPVNGLSMLDAADLLKRFVLHEREGDCVDIVVAELDPALLRSITSAIAQKRPIDRSVAADMFIPLVYISEGRGLEVRYTDMEGLQWTIYRAKEDMTKRDQSHLYQICMKEHQSGVGHVLRNGGFEIL